MEDLKGATDNNKLRSYHDNYSEEQWISDEKVENHARFVVVEQNPWTDDICARRR